MLWVLLLLAAVLVALPYLQESRRGRMGSAPRRAAPGSFARLSQGVTHYRWHGPARGPVVVAVHGLTTPSPVWDDLAQGLAALGYRTLVYDLLGRGYSDRPGGVQDAVFFRRQLLDLMDHLSLGDEVILMGFSMGGAIVTDMAVAAPERLNQLILLAPAGMDLNETRVQRVARALPWVGDLLHHIWEPVTISRATEQALQQGERADLALLQRNELDWQGYLPAVLASRRGILAGDQQALHQQIAQTNLPVTAVWGQEDAIIPISALGRLTQWNRNIRQEVIADAGHGLVYTHADTVVARLRDVFREPR